MPNWRSLSLVLSLTSTALCKQQLSFETVFGYHTILCQSTVGDGILNLLDAEENENKPEEPQSTLAIFNFFMPMSGVAWSFNGVDDVCYLNRRNFWEIPFPSCMKSLTLAFIPPTRWEFPIPMDQSIFPPSRNFKFPAINYEPSISYLCLYIWRDHFLKIWLST